MVSSHQHLQTPGCSSELRALNLLAQRGPVWFPSQKSQERPYPESVGCPQEEVPWGDTQMNTIS